MYVMSASRPRCAVVAVGLTATLWGAVAVLVGVLMAPPPETTDQGLVRLCLGALAVAAGWAWLQAMAGVADAWRGVAACATRHGVRRLALAVCGVVLAGAVCGPAHAGTASISGTGRDRRDQERRRSPIPKLRPTPWPGYRFPSAPRVPPIRGRRTTTSSSGSGDTLWALAEHHLPARSTDGRVTTAWHDLYRRNRDVIGPDPDLILPGQVLRLTKEKTMTLAPLSRPGRLRAGHPGARPEPALRAAGAARAHDVTPGGRRGPDRPERPRPAPAVGPPLRPGERGDRRRRPARQPAAALDQRTRLRRPPAPRDARGARGWPPAGRRSRAAGATPRDERARQLRQPDGGRGQRAGALRRPVTGPGRCGSRSGATAGCAPPWNLREAPHRCQQHEPPTTDPRTA